MAEQERIEADTGLAELSRLARLLVDSWNCGDARALTRLFTPAAEYVTGAGDRIRGREAISALLDKTGSASHVILVGQPVARSDSRQAELRFMWSSAQTDGGRRHGSITCACVRQGSGWLIEALHNDEVRESRNHEAAQRWIEADERRRQTRVAARSLIRR